MRLRTIELEGFRSFRDHETVDLTDLNLTAVVGQNHQGKSTLIASAVMFALYGVAPGAVVKDAITRGENKATVTVVFDLADSTYRVTRSRTIKGRPEVYVSVSDPNAENGWRALEEKYAKSGADQFIVNLLGMDHQTARATWMIEQGDFASFAVMDPAPRREVLANAFNLKRYEPLAAEADTRRRRALNALEMANHDVESLTARQKSLEQVGPYPDLTDSMLESEAKDAERAAEEATKSLGEMDDPELASRARAAETAVREFDAAHQREADRHEQDRARLARTLEQAQNALQQAQNALQQANGAQEQFAAARQAVAAAQVHVKHHEDLMATLRKDVDEHTRAAAAARSAQESLARAGTEVKERIEGLVASAEQGQGQCFTCHQSLTPERAQSLIQDLQQERANLGEQWKQCGQEVATREAQINHLNQKGREADAAARQARSQEAAAQQAATRAGSLIETIPEREAAVAAAQEQVTAAENDVLNQGPAPQIDQVRRQELVQAAQRAKQAHDQVVNEGAQRRAALTQSRDEARRRYRALWQEQSRREDTAKALEDLKEPLREAVANAKKAEQEANGYSILHEAYRPTGIPAMILATVIEELNEEANDILAIMGSDLGVNVTTQKETQRGTTQEKVMVYAMTADGPADFKTLSGQEQYFVALALRLGLSECIARRTGTPIQTIVQDEGWGALDEVSRKAVMDALLRISERFSVFSVTHVTEVKDSFPTVIEVSAQTGTSRAQVIRR